MRSYLIVQEIKLFLLFCLCYNLIVVAKEDEESIKPELNVTDSFLDVKVNSFLAVKCKGQHSLSWGYIDPMSDDKQYEDVASWDNTPIEGGYESTLKLHFTSYSQTGKYVCFDGDLTASIYIYVNDATHLLLPLDEEYFHIMFLHQGVPATIPCLPTVSGANVTLWKSKEVIPLSNNLKYDPTIGFIVKYPTSYFRGSFHCLAEYEGLFATFNLEIDTLQETHSVPEVVIDDSNAKYVLVHSNFNLTCMVKVDLGTTLMDMQWTYPVKEDSRIIKSKLNFSKNMRFKITSETLVVTDVEKSDEGNYQCNVTDHSGKTNYHEVYIKVYENPQLPTVNFSTEGDTVIKTRGESVELRAHYSVFPYTSDIRNLWTKDGSQLPLNIEKYSTKTYDSEFILEITNLTKEDFGSYTVTAYTPGGSYSKTFLLQVKDVPTIKIYNISSACYMPGKISKFLCWVEGFPSPEVTWSWKPFCRNEQCNSWKTVDESYGVNNDSAWTTGGDEKEVTSMLSIIAQQSAYYKCQARNEMGITEVDMEFIVTDVQDCFDLFVSNESPLESEPLSLVCRATLDLFEELKLEWKSTLFNQSNEISKEELSSLVSPNSIFLKYELSSTAKNDTGIFICSGILRNQGGVKTKSVVVDVQEIKKPYFLNENWKDSTVRMASNSAVEFECYAKGTPMPTVVWYRDGKIIDGNTTGGKFEDNYQKFFISRLVKDDSGFYECQVQNIAGVITRNISLLVISENNGLQVSQPPSKNESERILMFVSMGVGAALLIIIIIILGRWFYRKKYTMLKLEGFNHQLFLEGRMSIYDPSVPLDDQTDLLPYDNKWEFPKEKLTLGRTLGQGAFGRVIKAKATGLYDYEEKTTVAVKMLKARADIYQQKALIAELKILLHLGHHINIVNLMGAVTKNISQGKIRPGELMVMVEYCRYGNLRDFLLRNRERFLCDVVCSSGGLVYLSKPFQPNCFNIEKPKCESVTSSLGSASTGIAMDNPSYRERLQSFVSTDEKPPISPVSRSMSVASSTGSVFKSSNSRGDRHQKVVYTSDLICYAYQSACGMEYLASKKLIHRDLAARNVLLAERNVVKICDFGLAKDCYNYENYVRKADGPLPIKWMAIESIRDHVFTTKSDVWSFAILLWEFFTLGNNPYPGIEIDEDFYKRLNAGYRMEKPDFSPDLIYDLIQTCWDSNPDVRPHFKEISEILGGFLKSGIRQHFKDLNTPYMEMNQDNQLPNYSNIEAAIGNMNTEYMNSSVNPAAMYDMVPKVTRPALSTSVSKEEAMEVVPMIQLETIREDEFEKNVSSLQPNVIITSSDYLKMGENIL